MRKQSTSEVEPSQELLEVRLATSCRKVGNEKKARPVRGTIGKRRMEKKIWLIVGTKRTTCFFSSSEKDIIIHPIAQPRNQGNMGASFHSLILYISSVSKGISAAF